ncbi:hypothetical protein PG994_013909 [Apiospora phragmitis]|uniref:NACHT domain-containing protein n=1 Tax=Apiospora phragmitis TaxID=2905665 RepID=A0ABR1T2U3_9PEZI
MDPLSAFSLATNILTFVEFSCKLVSDSWAIYKSAAGASDNSRALETIATQITHHNTQLVSLPTYPDQLRVLCVECNNVANDILAAIKKLRGGGKNKGWDSFKGALRETWSQGKINDLDKRLQRLQQQLVVQIQFLMLRRLESLEADVLQVLKSLQAYPEGFSEKSGALVTTVGDYSEEAKTTAWYQGLIESLHYPRFESRHDAISTAHANTFKWILSDTDISGGRSHTRKAGSGKSTLMKFRWHHGSTRKYLKAWSGTERLVMASYFFWAAGDELQKSEEGLVRALLFDILRACPEELASSIKSDLSASAILTEHPRLQTWTRSTLLKVFNFLMDQKLEAKFCFFIDGLDEYKGNTQGLVDLVQKLVSYPNIKICVSSRPWAAFRHVFGEDDNADWHIKLENLTKGDIRQYVYDKLDADAQFSRLKDTDVRYSDIADQVMLRAQGVFLWVVLVVRSLLEGAQYDDDIADMRCRLDAIPDNLDDLFRQMLDIPEFYRSQSAMTFKIALAAESPLPLVIHGYADEIHRNHDYAMAVPFIPLGEAGLQRMTKQIPNRLDTRCKGLLEMVKRNDSLNMY